MERGDLARIGILLALCTSTLASSSSAQTAFTTTYRYRADTRPLVGELGHVNGDSNLDYVVTNSYSRDLTVWLGMGDGTLRAVPGPSFTDSPRGLALGELNGDGMLDAVVVLPSDGKIEVLFGDGTGRFSPGGSYLLGGFPVWVELGLLDGDGLLDIAVGNQSPNSVSILLGTGGGSFGPKTDYATGYSCEEIALGDIDGDGDVDIVVGSWLDHRVVSMLGDGTGSFSMGSSRFASSPKSIALADMDGSGTLDLVTVSSGSDVVQVFPGSSTGALGPPSSNGTGHYPAGVAIVDMNLDDVPDVVASCVSDDTLTLLAGLGGGELALAIESPANASGWHLVAGDLNHDDLPDLVVAESLQNRISVYLADGVGSYVKYCTGKVNSLGCLPELYAWGTPSLSNLAPFYISASNLRSAQMAMFIYKVNGARADLPFQGGTLCIGPGGIRRTPMKNTGGYPANGLNCTGVLSMNFNEYALGLLGGDPDPALLVPGNTYRVQVWGRDNGDAFGSMLTGAIEVTPWL